MVHILKWDLSPNFDCCNTFNMVDANEVPSIIKQISHIEFPYLKSLNVWNNKIVSIEGITRLSMPSLEKLWIWDNLIMSIRPLRKMDWPMLTVLDMSTTHLSQSKTISWNIKF